MSTEESTAGEMEGMQEEQLYVASQWELMWWKFKQHKLAVAALVVIVIFYLVAIFADFFAPYDPHTRHRGYILAPPQRVHFVHPEDGFSLRPFVYDYEQEIDYITGSREYHRTGETSAIYFFVRGEPYELLGLIESDLRLFGTEDGGLVFLFGTDTMARDLLSQIIFGSRISLSIGLLGVFMTVFFGMLFGGISGFFGGVVDSIIQRATEVIKCFPYLALWMILAAALPEHWTQLQVYFAIVVILSGIGWTNLGRQIRGMIYSLKEEDFVVAARISGCSTSQIIGGHMIPSFISHIIATLTLAIPGMIIGETSLSFLGIGLQRPVISWGVLLEQAQNVRVLLFSPWLLIPGLFIVVAVLAFNFLGDGLRDAADPYSAL